MEGASLGSGGAGFAGRLCRSEKMPADDAAGLAVDVTNQRPLQGPGHAAPGRPGLCPGTAVPRAPGLLPRASLTVPPASRSLSFRSAPGWHLTPGSKAPVSAAARSVPSIFLHGPLAKAWSPGFLMEEGLTMGWLF